MGGEKPFVLADEAAWIRARLAEKPDITGRELLAELNLRGVEVSYYGVWHFLDRAGLIPAPVTSCAIPDLTDAEWEQIRPLIPPAKSGGGKRTSTCAKWSTA
jgi:hypothetical protein